MAELRVPVIINGVSVGELTRQEIREYRDMFNRYLGESEGEQKRLRDMLGKLMAQMPVCPLHGAVQRVTDEE